MAAGMAEVAKATVTIIPTMEGSQAIISKELGAAAEPAGDSAGDTAGNSFGAKFVSTVKKVVTAAAIGKAITSSLTAGADLQQSIGGVETLFKDSADTVIAYAEQAYKTAGVSANTYMENVTSFSATLLQGLEGNTAAAAEYANLAMVDMSDNANKMGTDIESIQNAYQGFAKQNYTMLDNLKLGYGGTAAEMARLINDSGVLGDSVEVTAETVEDVPFNQVIQAIHKIQDNLDITGTTSKEAATTFSGSLASMKAAGENLLANLSLGEDIGPVLSALLKTVNTFAVDNLFPMLCYILTGLPGVLPSLVTGVAAIISELAQQMPMLLTELFDNIGQAITDTLSELGLDDEAETFTAAWSELRETISTVLRALQDFFTWLASGSASAEVFKTIILGIVAGFVAWKTAMAISDIISGVSSAITAAKGAFAAFNAVLSANPIAAIVTLIATLSTVIVYLWNNCEWFRDGVITAWEAIKSAFQSAGDAISGVLTDIGIWMDNCKENIANTWNAIMEDISAVWEGIKTAVSTGVNSIKETVSTVFNTVKSTASNTWNSIKSTISTIVESIKSKVSSTFESVKSTVSTVFNTVKSTVSSIWNGIKNTITTSIETAKNTVKNVLDSISSFFSGCKLQLPSIKLPHFSITGSLSINPPSVPHISVSWYREGGILTEPTIFGALGNTLLAGGEAGDEAVLPLKSFYDKLETIIDGQSTGISLQINIDRFENSSQQDIKEFAQQVAEEIQHEVDRRREAV